MTTNSNSDTGFQIEEVHVVRIPFKRAQRRHKMVRVGVTVFDKGGMKDDGEAVWEAITGMDELDNAVVPTPMADAMKVTCPVDFIPVVRAHSGIAAAYAFEAAAMFWRDANAGEDEYECRQAAKKAWGAFGERVKQAKQVKEGFGWDWSPCWEMVRDINDMSECDVREIEAIAQLAGRMWKAVASDVARERTDDPHEVVDVKVGGDVERVLASEIAQLFVPEMEDMAAIKILEDRAAEYRMQGVNSVTRGPLVLVLDESGSMHDDGHGYGYKGRNTWAKACALALLRLAHQGNRMVRVVHFSTGTAVTECAPGDTKAVLRMLRHFFGGGTDIGTALEVALDQVGELEKNGYVGADIVLVTDGEDGSYAHQEKVLNECVANGVRLWTVGIEMEIDKAAPIRKYAEKVLRVGGTQEADLVGQLRDAATNLVSQDDIEKSKARNAAMN